MMPDIEKVIKGLEGVYLCISPVNHTCGDCPYQDNHVECIRRVLSDAIALLKEQEPVKPTIGSFEAHDGLRSWWYQCGKCGMPIDHVDGFCRHCGKKVKWE